MTLNEIFQPVSHELQLVRQHLKTQLNELYSAEHLHDDEKFHAATITNHFFAAPGKGLRPALVLLAGQLTEAKDDSTSSSRAVSQFATVVELFHSASLIHDDVIDRAPTRRNQMSLNERFGDHIAVVVGDEFILEAFSLLFDLNSSAAQQQQVFRIMRRTLRKMCLGGLCEYRLLTTQELADVEGYMKLLDQKTAALMSACCQCSAILTGSSPDIQQQMADFGTHFGLAFQMADDLKDQDALLKAGIDVAPLAKSYVQKAQECLSSFPGTPARQSLMALCDIVLPAPDSPGMFDLPAG